MNVRADDQAPAATQELNRRRRIIEFAATILLAFTSVATLWSGYQASLWSGIQATNYNQANALRVELARRCAREGKVMIPQANSDYTWHTFHSNEHVMGTATRQQMKKIYRSVTSLSLLALTVWLCGCSGVSVKGTWQDGAPRNQTYAKLLVIGVSPDRDLRCAFEADFASQLTSASTAVITSCSQMSAKEPLTHENVERVAASVHADAVLATRLVSMHFGHGQGNSDDMRGDSVYKADDFAYGAYGMPVTDVEFQTAPPLTSLTSSLHVVTKLYETHGATLIYTIDTVTKSQEIDSTEATLLTITAPTADRLRRAGLIR